VSSATHSFWCFVAVIVDCKPAWHLNYVIVCGCFIAFIVRVVYERDMQQLLSKTHITTFAYPFLTVWGKWLY